MAHTPGPWKVNLDADYKWPTDEIEIMDKEGDGFVAVVYAHTSPETQKTNAALIAAAPELLDACRLMVEELDRVYGVSGLAASSAVYDLISRAEGVR